ncbi:MAG TPA: tripartite tricarboxylate transporter substrate-binding protein [Pseudolabrys sp.]|nr:tripartite tricarboxylate transporter substrate-binding protein [Pseudolabrys sp.]
MLALTAAPDRALAQSYPTRPITIIVPSAAGGPTDALTRVIAEYMREALGQPVVVENQGTAGGTVAVGRVAHAAPDGYTLCIGQWGNFVINQAVYPLQYDLVNDFSPIALLASNPQLIVARKDFPAANLKGLIAWLKDHPGKASQGTAGAGSPAHVGGAYFQQTTGTSFQFVPYRGAAPAMLDLLGGRIDLLFDQASNSLPHLRNGEIKAFAVTASSRLPGAPEIPTVDQAGLPGFYVSVWHGMWAPKGTPAPVIAKLNAAVVAALNDATVRKHFAALGQQIPPREQQSPEALAAYQRAEAAKWWPIVKAANISASLH